MHQAAKASGHRRSSRIAQRKNATAKILPEQPNNLHDRNLISKTEEIAATAKTTVHCQ